MSLTDAEKGRLKKVGLTGLNKPKMTPSHKSKKGVVAVRHGKNIAKGKISAAYWADKVLWGGPSARKKSPPKSQKNRFG